ncbi:hypothetical protein chiPu_0000108 [Chiloscyllium punctatum]|uniref:Uncharacterized protein n=1 Tax=Chiloscyllium punctatum TaxID=137246 RepID=A0A401RS16_CHIPU|nr:hypothetical protein [Chiloscyllium punctatum]
MAVLSSSHVMPHSVSFQERLLSQCSAARSLHARTAVPGPPIQLAARCPPGSCLHSPGQLFTASGLQRWGASRGLI